MKRAIIVIGLILIGLSVSAEAQRRVGRVPRVNRVERNTLRLNGFDRLDLNRDGYISYFEWRGNRRRFNQLDFNNDRRISRSEWRFGRRRR